jgi:hypothetical protein
MNLLEEASIESNLIWKTAGKPKHGPIIGKRPLCRLQYRKRIREHQNNEMSADSNDLHEALLEKMALSGNFGRTVQLNVASRICAARFLSKLYCSAI